MVRENNADKELKTRLYVTICCSMMGMDFLTNLILAIQFKQSYLSFSFSGMCIFTVMLLAGTAYVAMSLLG